MRSLLLKKLLISIALALSLSLGTVASASEPLPVLVDGRLMGAFGPNGKWLGDLEDVTVLGRKVLLSEAGEDEELMRLFEREPRIKCETPWLTVGRDLVFYDRDGLVGRGKVESLAIVYEGEASGTAALEVGASLKLNRSGLIVGLATELERAQPAPTRREARGQGLAFLCNQGSEFSVFWEMKDQMLAGSVSVGGQILKLPDSGEDGPRIIPHGLDSIDCVFLDLNGDKALELIIHDSSPNGFAAIVKVDPKAGLSLVSWLYLGAE